VPLDDPLAAEPFGGDAEELVAVHGYQTALDDLRKLHAKAKTDDAHDSSEDDPKPQDKKKKKGAAKAAAKAAAAAEAAK